MISIIAFGLIGFFRGWRREVISLAFALTAVLFLLLNGGTAVAQLVFVKTPSAFQYFTSGKVQTFPQPSPTAVLASTLIAFALIVLLGYYIGNRAFPSKSSTLSAADHLLGILPGLVTGYFLITYISKIFATSPIISVGVGTPTQSLLSDSLPLLFIVAVVAVIAGLIAARAKKSSATKK
ncbi:MAG TPA: CvpA family protein [Ktedonobacteraceae bacterium]|nr:CvpA family protein [Ktedonobacteraceae bacterium]